MLYIYHKLYEEQILPYLKTWNITKSNIEACQQTDFKSLFFVIKNQTCTIICYQLTFLDLKNRIKIRFLNLFMILLPILWYEYSVPWTKNREKICLRTFCMPFATDMIIKHTFWEINKSLLTKYLETIDPFCTNQLDKFCEVTVSLLY